MLDNDRGTCQTTLMVRIQDMLSEGNGIALPDEVVAGADPPRSATFPSESMSDRILVQFTDHIYLTALEAFDVFDQAAEQLEEENNDEDEWKGVYPGMCINPEICRGYSHCPRDYSCSE